MSAYKVEPEPPTTKWCPTCGSDRRDVCKINADPQQSCWAVDPDPWHEEQNR